MRFSRGRPATTMPLVGEHHGLQPSGRSTGPLPAESGAALSCRCARATSGAVADASWRMYGMAESTDGANSGESAAVGSRASMPVPARCAVTAGGYRIVSDTSGASCSGTVTVLCSA
jgi:hypothetical protein